MADAKRVAGTSCYSVVCKLPSGAWGWQQWQRFEFFGVLLMVAGGSHLLASFATTPSRGRARLMTSRSWEIAVGVLGLCRETFANQQNVPLNPIIGPV